MVCRHSINTSGRGIQRLLSKIWIHVKSLQIHVCRLVQAFYDIGGSCYVRVCFRTNFLISLLILLPVTLHSCFISPDFENIHLKFNSGIHTCFLLIKWTKIQTYFHLNIHAYMSICVKNKRNRVSWCEVHFLILPYFINL